MIKLWVVSTRIFPHTKTPVAARSSFEEARELGRSLALRYGKGIIEQGTEGGLWRFFPEDAPPGSYGSLVNVDPIEPDTAVPDWALELLETWKD